MLRNKTKAGKQGCYDSKIGPGDIFQYLVILKLIIYWEVHCVQQVEGIPVFWVLLYIDEYLKLLCYFLRDTKISFFCSVPFSALVFLQPKPEDGTTRIAILYIYPPERSLASPRVRVFSICHIDDAESCLSVCTYSQKHPHYKTSCSLKTCSISSFGSLISY